jgi:hypothetical protein
MVIVCAWCRKQVGMHGRDDGRTSHTVCDTCLGRLIRSVSWARETTVLPSYGDRAPDAATGTGDPRRHVVVAFATDRRHDHGPSGSEDEPGGALSGNSNGTGCAGLA